MVLSPVELMHGSKFCLNCVLYGHILSVYIGIRNAYSNRLLASIF